MYTLKIEKPIPNWAIEQLELCGYVNEERICYIYLSEEDAVTYIHPESFEFSEVYGGCAIMQREGYPAFVSVFEFQKNQRSAEQETIEQLRKYHDIPYERT